MILDHSSYGSPGDPTGWWKCNTLAVIHSSDLRVEFFLKAEPQVVKMTLLFCKLVVLVASYVANIGTACLQWQVYIFQCVLMG